MNSTVDMGCMFIVPDVTVPASLQIINIGDTGLWETDSQFVYFHTWSCML